MSTQESAALKSPGRETLPVQRPSQWGMVWAVLGIISTAVILIGWIRWVGSPDLKRTDPGPDPFPQWKMAYLYFVQVCGAVGTGVIVWRCVLKPIIRERRLSLDGKFVIACGLLYFYDPATVNVFNFSYTYNAHLLNFGSWANFIPGWQAPSQQFFSEPLLTAGTAYIWWLYLTAVLGCWFLRRLKARYPKISPLGMFTVLGVVILFLDLVGEPTLFVFTEVWAYPGCPGFLTLFSGSRYQFPIWEPILVGFSSLSWVALRWYTDDRGRSFVEKGIESLPIPGRAKGALSLFSVIGFIHATLVVTFIIPFNIMALYAHTFPAMPSYFRVGICGEGTQYACPSQYVPIPKKGSLYIRPDDPRLPAEVRERQGVRY